MLLLQETPNQGSPKRQSHFSNIAHLNKDIPDCTTDSIAVLSKPQVEKEVTLSLDSHKGTQRNSITISEHNMASVIQDHEDEKRQSSSIPQVEITNGEDEDKGKESKKKRKGYFRSKNQSMLNGPSFPSLLFPQDSSLGQIKQENDESVKSGSQPRKLKQLPSYLKKQFQDKIRIKNMGISILKVPKSIQIAPKGSGDKRQSSLESSLKLNDTSMGLTNLKLKNKSRNAGENSVLYSTDNQLSAEKATGFGSPFIKGGNKRSPLKSLDKIQILEEQGDGDLNFKIKPKGKEPANKGIQTFESSERNGLHTPDRNSKSWSLVSAGSNVFHIDGSNLNVN